MPDPTNLKANGKQKATVADPNRRTRKLGQGRGKPHSSPEQIKRREEVFERRVLRCQTITEVCEAMGICRATVVADCKAELELRSAEMHSEREVMKAEQLAKLDDLYRKALEDRRLSGTGAYGAASKVLEMRSKVTGVDAPTKVDLGLQQLFDALSGDDDLEQPLDGRESEG